MNTIVQLLPLECSDREQFISDNQEAFNYGAMEEFGLRDDHFEEDGQIISRDTIGQSIDSGEAYRIILDGQKVGGLVIKVDGEKGDLDLLFVSPTAHSKGIGYAAWCAVEKLHPEVNVWETVTPILSSVIFIFMLIVAAFTLWSFSTNITQIQMIRKCAPKNWTSSSRTECSGLKRSLGNFQFVGAAAYGYSRNPRK